MLDTMAEIHRRGTPHWAIQAAKAEACRSMIVYLLNNYELHAREARQGLGGTVKMPRLVLVEE